MKCILLWSLLLSSSLFAAPPSETVPLQDIQLPSGFKIDVFADVPGARSMALAEDGTVFVGTRTRSGTVYAVRDSNKDGKADKVWEIANGLNMPNGVAYKDGHLYVAEVERILKFPNILSNLDKPGKPQVVYDQFPRDMHHGWKYIAFGPDGKLYVPVGAPCNICDADADAAKKGKYMRLFRMNADGTGFEEFARGIRNTVGFTWHPTTKELWFTDNGRDMMGNDVPPDELNRAPKPGLNFGYPFVHGRNLEDPEFYKKRPKNFSFVKPEVELEAHVAALGLKFYTGKQFPKDYQNRIFIAEHGSWNRDPAQGYRVMMVSKDKKGYRYEPFASGWLRKDQSRWGRPVDILVTPDGSMLVSDDEGGRIFRIRYEASKT